MNRWNFSRTLLSSKQVFAYAGLVCTFTILLYALPSGPYIQQHFADVVDFRIRTQLGLDPSIDPRIKVFAVDDSSVAWMKNSELGMSRWAYLITSISRANPKRIFIDKIFGFPNQKGSYSSHRKGERRFIKAGKSVVGGAFVAPRKLKYRSTLNLERADFRLDSYVKRQSDETNLWEFLSQPGIPRSDGKYVYGPYEDILPAFRHVGHIHYQGDGRIAPLLRVGSKSVLPHLTFYASEKSEIKNGSLYLNDRKIPVDDQGYTKVNFIAPKKLYKAARSLSTHLRDAVNGRKNAVVQPGDYVMILPMLYTGNTDFKWTPLGMLPASFAHIATLNSLLTDKWIRPLGLGVLFILLGCLAGAAVGAYCESMGFWISNLLGNSLVFIGAQYLFAKQGVSVPWIFLTLSFGATSFSIFFAKSRLLEARARSLRNALDGAISEKRLSSLTKNPRDFRLDAKEQVVSIMFIDVVGYSLMAENQVPRLAFDQLKYLLGEMSKDIHRYGGIVNKTLGDGLLCLFGYDFETETVMTDHAERAVACAVRIQQKNLKRNLEADERKESIFPLRIGIHTASVFLGDLGSGERIDFTAVGNGVNYAKRMEQACEMYSVLFSSTTRDLVSSLKLSDLALKKRKVSIKHHSSLVEAYEYDPFHSDAELRERAVEAYRRCASIARLEQRYTLSHPELLCVSTTQGEGTLLNYSINGLSIKLPSMLVKGSKIKINLDSHDGALNKQLARVDIGSLDAEVRWMYAETDGHVHGVLIKDMDEVRGRKLVDALKHFDLTAKSSRTQTKIA